MQKPDTARFLADLHELRGFGAFRTGVHCGSGSRLEAATRAR